MSKLPKSQTLARFDSVEDIARYLNKALKTGDPGVIATRIGTVARARGMRSVARDANMNRENLYRLLRPGKHPEFNTIMKVLNALGIELVARGRS
jgi:probable addiction module antidote protein